MDNEKRKPLQSLILSAGVAIVLLTPLVVFVVLRSHEQGPGLRDSTAAEGTTTARKVQPRAVIPVLESEQPKKSAPRPAPMTMAAAPPPAPVTRGLPPPTDIPIGIDKSSLLASFGKPNMVTTEVTEGRALETLRYLRPESGTEVVVFLRSGRVVGTSSVAY
jgi:hypothetical protein